MDDYFYSGDYFASTKETADVSESDLPEDVARLTYQGSGFRIDYPAGRESTVSSVFIVLGVIFSAVAIFMGYQIASELASERISYFSIMVMGMILMGFSLFGIGMLIGGIYMKTNRLSVEKTSDKLVTRRRVFGREFEKTLLLDDIYALEKKVTSQSGQGASSKISYTIYAKTLDGLKHSIGDGIAGHENADRLYDIFNSEISLSDKQPSPRQKGKPEIPEWAKHLPVIIKVFGYVMFIVVIGAFVMDFVR